VRPGWNLAVRISEAETAAVITAWCSRSDNLRKSRQFLVGAVIGD
jgi:hypothetical protein